MWELQKSKTGTPWGSGVRIANTSNVDSHIRYGPKGVVLSNRTVEEDSIKKLVADLQRLSNAHSFTMGMRKLLEVKPDERIYTGNTKYNMKTQSSMKMDGGYGGGWVPLAALKKVLRGILKYLRVLWLFSQLPDL